MVNRNTEIHIQMAENCQRRAAAAKQRGDYATALRQLEAAATIWEVLLDREFNQ